jgi:CxxC motif-containing protein (DUF1111 family)
VVQQRTVTGRFCLKAKAPHQRQQSAGALVGDQGITTPLFPTENCTAVQKACQQAPSGGHPELSKEQLDEVEFYLSHLAVPARRNTADPLVQKGEALFAAVGCETQHRPL